jgi:cation-transporting ATPase E
VTGTVQAAASSAGLTAADAERRLRERGPQQKESSSRSYRSIAVANTFTIFNAILAAFGAATIAFGDPRDALFLGILIANTAIGTFQEVRAKRELDKLAALVAPTATVVRDGRPRSQSTRSSSATSSGSAVAIRWSPTARSCAATAWRSMRRT